MGGVVDGDDVWDQAELEFHIDPRNPRADCTISAARFTRVPACSCMPSNDTRCARDVCLDGLEFALSRLFGDSAEGEAGLDSVVVVDGDTVGPMVDDVGCGCAFCASGTCVRKAATGEFAGVGCLDLRCSSSSSGIGEGIATAMIGDLEDAPAVRLACSYASRACW